MYLMPEFLPVWKAPSHSAGNDRLLESIHRHRVARLRLPQIVSAVGATLVAPWDLVTASAEHDLSVQKKLFHAYILSLELENKSKFKKNGQALGCEIQL
jgi:hypothetical protein